MNSGKITDNKGTNIDCGGVNMTAGTFIMNGGNISGNSGKCGGVYVTGGNFTMNSGRISGNTANQDYGDGGGVYIENGAFIMNNGEISGNIAGSSHYYNGNFGNCGHGGGVYVENGAFTMNGGEISGNTAKGNGGGVFVHNGPFTMSGGNISANISTYDYGYGHSYGISDYVGYGGGVFVFSNVIFTKTGGTITGYSSDPVNGNVVKDNSGNIESNLGHSIYLLIYMPTGPGSWLILHKEDTAGPSVNLSYDYNNGAPTWSGDWIVDQ